LALPIQDIKIQNGSSYDHKDHCLNSGIVIRCLDYVQPDEIQPPQVAVANAIAHATTKNGACANAVATAATANNFGAENCTRAGSAESAAYARADRGETDSNACAASRRQSLSGPPSRELQRQKISLHGERKGSRAYAIPRLGSKEYRGRHHLNVYRYEER